MLSERETCDVWYNEGTTSATWKHETKKTQTWFQLMYYSHHIAAYQPYMPRLKIIMMMMMITHMDEGECISAVWHWADNVSHSSSSWRTSCFRLKKKNKKTWSWPTCSSWAVWVPWVSDLIQTHLALCAGTSIPWCRRWWWQWWSRWFHLVTTITERQGSVSRETESVTNPSASR